MQGWIVLTNTSTAFVVSRNRQDLRADGEMLQVISSHIAILHFTWAISPRTTSRGTVQPLNAVAMDEKLLGAAALVSCIESLYLGYSCWNAISIVPSWLTHTFEKETFGLVPILSIFRVLARAYNPRVESPESNLSNMSHHWQSHRAEVTRYEV